MSKCGDLGHTNQAGAPCGQITAPGQPCKFHGPPEEMRLHQRTAGAHNIRSLPPDSPVPRFESRAQIVAYAERTAHEVATGHLDPRLSAELRGWCDVAMKSWALEAELRLAAIERHLRRKKIT